MGNDINAHAKDGGTSISVAAKYSNVKLARISLQKGTNPDAANEDGITPVMYAAAKDKSRRDGLMYATENNYRAKFMGVPEYKASVNAVFCDLRVLTVPSNMPCVKTPGAESWV